MKINIIGRKTPIREKFVNLRDKIFPQRCIVVEPISPEANSKLAGITEDSFELQGNQQLTHGVVITRNNFGRMDYSAASSKQSPLKYDFILHEQKSKNEHITNLTNELERVYYNGMEFDKLFKNNPQLSRFVGALPQKWGRKIGSSPKKIEQIDNLFAEFSKEFHLKVKDEYSTVEISTKKLQQGLSKVLDTDVLIEPIGKGSWGHTYKLNADSQDYVLKVYYNRCPKGYGMQEHFYGNANELSSAVWTSKNDADSYAMFYMGRFGENNDGYMLTKYIPEKKVNGKIYNGKIDLEEDNFVFSRYLHKSYCGDVYLSNGNRIGKKIVDFGDVDVSNAGKLDEKTFRLTKTLGRLIDENNSKELAKVVEKYKGTQEFEQAKSFLQYLINEHTTIKNANILKSKKNMFNQIGIDYVPDICYVLSKMEFPLPKEAYESATEYRIKEYSNILEIPQNAFESLWYKYSEILGINKK